MSVRTLFEWRTQNKYFSFEIEKIETKRQILPGVDYINTLTTFSFISTFIRFLSFVENNKSKVVFETRAEVLGTAISFFKLCIYTCSVWIFRFPRSIDVIIILKSLFSMSQVASQFSADLDFQKISIHFKIKTFEYLSHSFVLKLDILCFLIVLSVLSLILSQLALFLSSLLNLCQFLLLTFGSENSRD